MGGIICLETEWILTKKDNRVPLNSEPLIKFISEMYGVPYIYRQIATLEELKYYLKQLQKTEYSKYDVIYFSFHGGTHSLHFEGNNEDLSLLELAEISPKVFNNRFVHFSSCRTLLGSDEVTLSFKNKVDAKVVSGYSKTVASDLSAIHDVAMFGEYFKHNQLPSIFNNLEKMYGGLETTLGFKVFY